MKGPGDFLSCIKSTSFKRQSPFKYNVFVVYIWNFFLSRFWCHFILGLVFLGVNCDQIFLTKPRLPVSLSYLTVSCFFFSARTVPIQERERQALYSSHSTHGDRPSAVLMKVVVHQYITRYLLCAQNKFLPKIFVSLKHFSLNPTSLVLDNSHFNTASFHFIWQIALTGSSCNIRFWWRFILPKQVNHLPKAGG